jgi:hypothetical protein
MSLYFDGETALMVIHDTVQAKVDRNRWFNEFTPIVKSPQRDIAESLLWTLHKFSICCAVVGEFPMFLSGILSSHSGLIKMYIAHVHQLFSTISLLLQICDNPAFSIFFFFYA